MKKINTAFLVSLLLCAVLWVGSQPIMAPTAVAQNVEIVTRIGAHTGEVLRVANDATDVIIGGCYLPASFTTTASLQDVFGTSTRVTADIAEQYTFGS